MKLMKRIKSNSIEVFIDNLHVTIVCNNVHIKDSFTVTKRKDIKSVLKDIKQFLVDNHITMDNPFNHRSICNMSREWITHNNLYKLNYQPERTKDCDLNYPQKWYMNILYFLGSLIVL